MAYAAITSLMGTLHLHFLQSEYVRFPFEDKQKMVSLHENLGFLQEILEESDDAAPAMKGLEAQIRDVLFKAETMIEIELRTIYLQSSSTSTTAACLRRLHRIFNQSVKHTDYLKKKLIRIRNDKGSSLPGRMRRTRGLLLGSTSSSERQNIRISRNGSMSDSRMVGCDKELMTILDQLAPQSGKQRQVVSIVGMGGIGKTTLARKVYEDPSITCHFDKQAWVTVSQEYDMGQMLQCLIGCVFEASGGDDEQTNNNQDKILAESLYKRLKGRRYLIVMDDIWSTTAWDSVQRCFPDDNNGSRILLTSRLKEVAKYASSGNSPLNMPLLDPAESWNLYCKVFDKTEFPFEFEKIGRDIVNKCEGLPLAIIVVASLLSKTEEKVEKWMNFAKSVSRSVNGDSNEACSRILYLSYNQLPYHLKACFLYFRVFPEDYEIPVKKLVRLWAAEGFLREELGMECLQDLVDRSLVMVRKQRRYNGEIIKTVRIHDLLRDLCLREARRENLLNVIAYEKPCSSVFKRISQHLFLKPRRWISIIASSNNVPITSKCFDKLHSLHVTSHYSFFSVVKYSQVHFKLLRVVDMNFRTYLGGLNVLHELGNLVHLRYLALSIGSCPRRPFRVKLFEHWNMQTFIVRGEDVVLDSSESGHLEFGKCHP